MYYGKCIRMTEVTDEKNQARNTNRAWFGTWNNYTEDDFKSFKEWCDKESVSYVIGKEMGEQGTPHLQLVTKFENKRAFGSMKKKWSKVHWEVCKEWRDSVRYCMKEGEYITKNIITKDYEDRPAARPTKKMTDRPTDRPTHEVQYEEFMKSEYDDIKWYEWQQSVIDLIESPASQRKVYWYWESEGNKGKSYLTRYLDWKYNAIIANGKQADIFNQYKMYLDTEKVQPTLAIIDIPRSHQDYVCYSTLEKIKDGLIYSGKYEGGKLRLIPHHLIIFANFEPCMSKLSIDRWVIKRIEH